MEPKRVLSLALFLSLLLTFPTALGAQATGRKPLDHDAYDIWRSIGSQVLADNGRWLVYTLVPGKGDATLVARNLRAGSEIRISRGADPELTADARFLVFTIEPMQAVVDSLEGEGKRGDDLPKDSLGVIDLSGYRGSESVTDPEFFKVARVKSWAVPEEGNGFLAYLLEAPEEVPDSAAAGEEEEAAAPRRRPGGGAGRPGGGRPGSGGGNGKEKDTGTDLVLRHLASGEAFTFSNAISYAFDEAGDWLVYAAENEEGDADGVFGVTAATGAPSPLLTGEGKYSQLTVSDEGGMVAFLTNRDDWQAEHPAFALYFGHLGEGEASLVANGETTGIPDGWEVSEHGSLSFSGGGTRLFFGTAPAPPPPPTDTLPEEEQVVLDIWNWKDPLIQPMQLAQLQGEQRRTYTAFAATEDLSIVQLATEEIPEVTVSREGEGDLALGTATLKYGYYVSHDGTYGDVFLLDVATGQAGLILEKQRNPRVSFSPGGAYAYWWDGGEKAWFVMDVEERVARTVTEALPFPVHEELDDHPDDPGSYGSAGWLEDDAGFLVYDDFDVWLLDPEGNAGPRNLTEGEGRDNEIRFRYLDPTREGGRFFGFGRGGGGTPFSESRAIPPDEAVLLSAFHTRTKASGFYRDRFDRNREPAQLLMGDFAFGQPRKADDADVVVLTRSTFREFPDLWVADADFENLEKVSDANPQQSEYRWGTAELVEWISNDGTPLQGILAKPEGFDPGKKYPMMVYFYERMSDGLHRYTTIRPGSSSVIPAFYVSRGYVFFIPDIPYEIGHPGESAVDAVVPGVLKILEEGYVDEERIGVQGHSWGGYQIAYMITRTNLFAAAEAGAPVANMTSAYGGIRWGSGMSRQFQYERTQSRIGGSLWEETLRYINNSPLFEADKVQTPLLMMHNDQDDAVPWYQGIEMYMALRRLQKPVWLLNYNGEPHGLRKRQNQKDWMVRMQQFFDHYLMGAPAPVWMTAGVPALMKGKTLGLEIPGG